MGFLFCLCTLEICFYVHTPWWSLLIIVEELSLSNNSESDIVGSSKLLLESPLVAKLNTKTKCDQPQTPMVEQVDDNYNRSHQLNQQIKRICMTDILQKTTLKIITESAAICCSFIIGFCMSYSLLATEKGHKIKCMGHFLVYLKQIHIIGTFFYYFFHLQSVVAFYQFV